METHTGASKSASYESAAFESQRVKMYVSRVVGSCVSCRRTDRHAAYNPAIYGHRGPTAWDSRTNRSIALLSSAQIARRSPATGMRYYSPRRVDSFTDRTHRRAVGKISFHAHYRLPVCLSACL